MDKIVTMGDAKRTIADCKELMLSMGVVRHDGHSLTDHKKLWVLIVELDLFITSEIDKAAEAGRQRPMPDMKTLDKKLDRIIELLQQTAGPKTVTATIKQRWVPAVGDMCFGPLGVGVVIRVLTENQLALVEFEVMSIKNKAYPAENISWVNWSELTPF